MSNVVVLMQSHDDTFVSGLIAHCGPSRLRARPSFGRKTHYNIHRNNTRVAHIAAGIFHDVDFVTVVKRLYRRQRNTGLRPKAGNENLLASAFFDRGDKVFVVSRIHRRTLDGFPPRKYGSQLRPHIPAEGLRLDRGQNYGHIEYPCGFSECHGVVDDSLAVEIACSKQHLALMVDQRHDAIVRSQEPLLTRFWTIAV